MPNAATDYFLITYLLIISSRRKHWTLQQDGYRTFAEVLTSCKNNKVDFIELTCVGPYSK